MPERKRIGILTSGGDAPGMNALIRAVVRAGIHAGMDVYGIKRGYEGLLNAEISLMDAARVSDIIQRGGTILRTARCAEMNTEEGQRKAADVVKVLRLDALVVAGGDGSFKGALALHRFGVNVIGVPATIDLDMDCTDYTIGFDTAVNTGLEAINRIRDTSSSHERCSVVEVMGRDAGYLALWCGLAGGAEEVLFPEQQGMDTEAVIRQIMHNRSKGKRHNLVVVAEGVGGSVNLAKEIEKIIGIESRATILGHLQRGGTPTAMDRMQGSQMGYMAVEAIKNNELNKAVVYREGHHALMDLNEAIACKKEISPDMYEMIKTLAI
jgi:6-phosphofructokinase 1